MTTTHEPADAGSADIDGMEQDVLHSFATLSPAARRRLFDHYEARFGRPARLYAERAATFWLSRRARMSRELTGRLFELTPAFLAPAARIELAGRLWRRKRGASDALLRVPPQASAEDIIAAVHAHYAQCLQPWQLSQALRERFPWLAQSDVEAQQKVLNMLLRAEGERLLAAADAQIRLLFADDARASRQVRQRLDVAGHKLELTSDVHADGLRVEPRRQPAHQRARADSLVATVALCFAAGAGIGLLTWWLVRQLP